MLEPQDGLLTFRAEGNNIPGSPWYSRKIHWPGNMAKCNSHGSGVTIGRGYDLGKRTRNEVMRTLIMAGISVSQAEKIAEGVKLTHCQAGEFVRKNKDKIDEITEMQQLKLFQIVYSFYVNDTARFYNCYKRIGAIPWEKMNSFLKEVLIDMKFQGIFRKKSVPVAEKNDPLQLIMHIKKEPYLLQHEENRKRIPHLMKGMKNA